MGVFTIFAFGTGESSTMAAKNVISQFSEACTSEKCVLEGPGTLGLEVAENARKGKDAIIDWLKNQTDDKFVVNLTGFSRGSITCIYIANALMEKQNALKAQVTLSDADKNLLTKLEKMELNLFANDPVAGITDKSKPEARIIPENVSNYVAILQLDEMRRDFKPQDITRALIEDPSHTKASFLPMYGNHSDTTKIKGALRSGAEIVWQTMFQFLTAHGTTFKQDAMPDLVSREQTYHSTSAISGKAILQQFGQHHADRNAYLQSGMTIKFEDGLPVPRVKRTINNHLNFYVKEPQTFVNAYERELFKLEYPKVFNYFFEQNMKDPRFPQHSGLPYARHAEITAELVQLRQTNPEHFELLKARGAQEVGQNVFFGEPKGLHYLEPCTFTQELFPGLDPFRALNPDAGLEQEILAINQLDILEKSVYRLSYSYEREKSELNFLSDRIQAQRSRMIREEVDTITSQPGTSQEKQIAILDCLEKHHKQLTQANSDSDLKGKLEETLSKHGRSLTGLIKPDLPMAFKVKAAEAFFTTLRVAVNFLGNLGMVGIIPMVFGIGIEGLGSRLKVILQGQKPGALNTTLYLLAGAMEQLGAAMKNAFGLKPLSNLLTQKIERSKEQAVSSIQARLFQSDFKARLPQKPDEPAQPAVDPVSVLSTKM